MIAGTTLLAGFLGLILGLAAGASIGDRLHPNPDGCDGPCFILDPAVAHDSQVGAAIGALVFAGVVVFLHWRHRR